MPITKQQRIYFAVLGLAAAAWAADRFVLGGGAGPSTAAASSLLITRAGPPLPASPLADQPAPVISLADRLDHFSSQWQDAAPARDVFTPPASWIPDERAAPLAAAGPSALAQAVAEFRQSHSLTAVIRAGKNSQIFLGARIIRLGDQIDGFRLIVVTESAATFDFHGAQATLQLAEPRDASTTGQTVPRNTN